MAINCCWCFKYCFFFFFLSLSIEFYTCLLPRVFEKNDTQGISMSEQRDRANNKSIRVYGSKELDGENGLRHACAMGREGVCIFCFFNHILQRFCFKRWWCNASIVLDVAGKALRPGVTTDEIDRIVHEASVERDCYPSPLNYYNFPKSVCTSVNEVICHGIPDYREYNSSTRFRCWLRILIFFFSVLMLTYIRWG